MPLTYSRYLPGERGPLVLKRCRARGVDTVHVVERRLEAQQVVTCSSHRATLQEVSQAHEAAPSGPLRLLRLVPGRAAELAPSQEMCRVDNKYVYSTHSTRLQQHMTGASCRDITSQCRPWGALYGAWAVTDHRERVDVTLFVVGFVPEDLVCQSQ